MVNFNVLMIINNTLIVVSNVFHVLHLHMQVTFIIIKLGMSHETKKHFNRSYFIYWFEH
jgi:hypothetical protein